ncbi:MAG: YqhA family protein [Pyrinomonadaceae bacterium]|nr:YqhA family protein [Pyrinomonadaceae bacterium]
MSGARALTFPPTRLKFSGKVSHQVNTKTDGSSAAAFAGLGRMIGRTRYVVILAVVAVLLLSMSLFLLGTVSAAQSIVRAWSGLVNRGDSNETEIVVETLSVIGVILRAVVFYIIGVGLYSLFITPLNLTAALGMESLADLESKVISVVVVILAVKFLQQFVQWNQPVETMQYGLTMAAVIISLVFFQIGSRKGKESSKEQHHDTQKRAQKEMFEENKEEREIAPAEVKGKGGDE